MKQPKEARRIFQKHPVGFLVGVVMMGTLGILIVAEFAVRLILPQWAPSRAERSIFWVYDRQLGWAHRPNQRGQFSHPDFSVTVNINSRGLRDDEYSMNRNTKKRMLILGDSFGWGFGVEHPDRFSEILERKHTNWEMINASVSGYSTDQEYLFLKIRGLSYQPDRVLLLLHDNDYSGNVSTTQYGYNKPVYIISRDDLVLQNTPVPTASSKQRMEHFLMGKTYLLRRIYLAGSMVCSYLKSGGCQDDSEGNASHLQNQYEITSRLVLAMNLLCKEAQSRLIIVSCPMNTDRQTHLKEICDREGIPYLSLDQDFAKCRETTTFLHDPHWNATGHRVAAEAIGQFLESNRLF